ncbi:transcriptional regulator [Vibrio sp. JCM 19236]|nr:transcriptional regulator [Vibrio sp. JCM 19236]
MVDRLANSLTKEAFVRMIVACCKINAVKMTKGKRLEGTIRSALAQLGEQISIDSTDTKIVLEQKPGYCWFYFKREGKAVVGDDIIGVLMILNLVQLLTGLNWLPEVITLRGNVSSKVDMAINYRHIEYKKDHKYSGLYVPDRLLDSQISEPVTNAIYTDYYDLHTFKYSLKKLLEPYISGATPTVAQAAQYANMSVRTLQRRLSGEGFSYSDVIFELVDEMTCDALINSDESISDLSYRLGYSHGSHMIRAFKKKFELTPKQFRDKYRVVAN